MTTISLDVCVDDETARAFLGRSDEECRKLNLILEHQLRNFFDPKRRSLLASMDEMSREAAANGLTPEILQSILEEEE